MKQLIYGIKETKNLIISALCFLLFAWGMENNRNFWTWVSLANCIGFFIAHYQMKELKMSARSMEVLSRDLKLMKGRAEDLIDSKKDFEKEILKDIMTELLVAGTEVIGTDGIRFSGLTEAKIKQIFAKHGVEYKTPF